MNKYILAVCNAVQLKACNHTQKDMPVEYACQKRIYTITTIDRSNSRCVAVASSWERAVVIVERNEADLCEVNIKMGRRKSGTIVAQQDMMRG
jgi:hypothetical protein